MMKELIVLLMFALVSFNIYAQGANVYAYKANIYKQATKNSLDELLRARTTEFMTARQSRKVDQIRKFYFTEDIQVVQNFIKQQYVSIKADMIKGTFTKAYVKRSIEESNFAEAYKDALMNFVFKDADIDKEIEKALVKVLGEYKFSIPKFEIKQVIPEANNQKASVNILEYRLPPGSKDAKPIARTLTWKLQNGMWYLDTDKPANL